MENKGQIKELNNDRIKGVSNRRKLFLLFLAVLVTGLLFVSRFTIAVHMGSDEELNASMAMSFHYYGKFIHEGRILNYSSILYPVVMSLGYFFYSPEHILLIFRIMNVIMMASAVFPAYILARDIFRNRLAGFAMTAVVAFIPEIALSAYIMQENLYYPLMLWMFAAIRYDLKENRAGKYTVLTGVLFMLVFYTKTLGFIFPLVYGMYLFIDSVKNKNKASFVKCLVLAGICAALLIGGEVFIRISNGAQGSNHYSNQVMNLFPINAMVIGCIIKGIIFYLGFTLLTMGVLPVILPFLERKNMDEENRSFTMVLYAFLLVEIAEIVILILCTENRGFVYPNKYIYRYMFPLFVPFFFMALSCGPKAFRVRKGLVISSWFMAIVVTLYYAAAGRGMQSAISDGFLFTTIENGIKYVFTPAGILLGGVLILASAILTVMYLRIKKENKEGKTFRNFFIRCVRAYMILALVINFVQLPYYTNVIADGNRLQDEYIDIANRINEAAPSSIYFVDSHKDYRTGLWAYMKYDYFFVRSLEDIEDPDAFVIYDDRDKKEYIVESW